MDVVLVVEIAAAIIGTAVCAWLVMKNHLVSVMNKLGEINEEIEGKMDILPKEAQDVAKEIQALIEEIRLSIADGQISFTEILEMAKHVNALYKEAKELADGIL